MVSSYRHFFFRLLEGTTFLRNVGKCLLFDTASYPRRTEPPPPAFFFFEIYKFIFTRLCFQERLLLDIAQYETMAKERDSGIIQGDSVARGPKLLSIKNYVIEIMT